MKWVPFSLTSTQNQACAFAESDETDALVPFHPPSGLTSTQSKHVHSREAMKRVPFSLTSTQSKHVHSVPEMPSLPPGSRPMMVSIFPSSRRFSRAMASCRSGGGGTEGAWADGGWHRSIDSMSERL